MKSGERCIRLHMQPVAWVEHSDTQGTLSRVSLRSTRATDYLCFSPDEIRGNS